MRVFLNAPGIARATKCGCNATKHTKTNDSIAPIYSSPGSPRGRARGMRRVMARQRVLKSIYLRVHREIAPCRSFTIHLARVATEVCNYRKLHGGVECWQAR